MDQLTFFLALIAGFLFGGAIVWLVQRHDVRQAYDRARTEFNAEIAGLNERIQSRDAQLTEAKKTLQAREQELAQLHAEWAKAAGSGQPLPDLDAALQPVRDSITRVGEQLAALKQASEELRESPQEAEQLREELSKMRRAGAELEESLLAFSRRFAQLGRSLEEALEDHAAAAAVLESRLVAGVRRLRDSAPLANLAGAVEGAASTAAEEPVRQLQDMP
jgi:chromosome segregation ATPase